MGVLLVQDQVSARLKDYGINHAALFDGSSGYLSRTFGAPTNSKIWTASFWLMRDKTAPSGYANLFASSTAASNQYVDLMINNDNLNFQWGTSGVSATNNLETAVRRDMSAFMHIVFAVDTNQLDGAERVKAYVNGDLIALSGTKITQYSDYNFNTARLHTLMAEYGSNPAGFSGGYLAEFHFVDGVQRAPTDFAKTDIATGNWVAKKYADTYGANGFYLDFSNAANLGEDRSGNANNWTVSASGVSQTTSTPTDTAAVLDHMWPASLSGTSFALSNGNRSINPGGALYAGKPLSLKIPGSGKWYIEASASMTTTGVDTLYFGVANDTRDLSAPSSAGSGCWHIDMQSGTNLLLDGVSTSNPGTPLSYGQRVQCFIDVDNDKLFIGINDAWYDTVTTTNGDPSTGANPTASGIGLAGKNVILGGYGSTVVNTIHVTSDEWSYTPPTGGKALITDNLPKVADDVSNHMQTLLFTGNGSATLRTDILWDGDFQPNLIMLKDRTTAFPSAVHDDVRGVTYRVKTDATDAEAGPTGFGADGFGANGVSNQLRIFTADPSYNALNDKYVVQGFSLPTLQANTNGSINVATGKQRVNSTLGMSVTEFTGTGAAATVGHGLSTAPGVVMVKNLTTGATNWIVYHSALGGTKALYLNLTSNAVTSSLNWNDTDPTNTVVHLGTSGETNASGDRMLMICFAESDFIKIGSYTGNSNADGALINCGVSPVYGLFKGNSTSNWGVYDSARSPHNPADLQLYANSPGAETSVLGELDFLANGVKWRDGTTDFNMSGTTYYYLIIGQPNGPTENTAR